MEVKDIKELMRLCELSYMVSNRHCGIILKGDTPDEIIKKFALHDGVIRETGLGRLDLYLVINQSINGFQCSLMETLPTHIQDIIHRYSDYIIHIISSKDIYNINSISIDAFDSAPSAFNIASFLYTDPNINEMTLIKFSEQELHPEDEVLYVRDLMFEYIEKVMNSRFLRNYIKEERRFPESVDVDNPIEFVKFMLCECIESVVGIVLSSFKNRDDIVELVPEFMSKLNYEYAEVTNQHLTDEVYEYIDIGEKQISSSEMDSIINKLVRTSKELTGMSVRYISELKNRYMFLKYKSLADTIISYTFSEVSSMFNFLFSGCFIDVHIDDNGVINDEIFHAIHTFLLVTTKELFSMKLSSTITSDLQLPIDTNDNDDSIAFDFFLLAVFSGYLSIAMKETNEMVFGVNNIPKLEWIISDSNNMDKDFKDFVELLPEDTREIFVEYYVDVKIRLPKIDDNNIHIGFTDMDSVVFLHYMHHIFQLYSKQLNADNGVKVSDIFAKKTTDLITDHIIVDCYREVQEIINKIQNKQQQQT